MGKNNGISSSTASNNGGTNGIPQQLHKCQNDDQKPSTKSFCIKSLVNLLIYVICILSLSISLYLSHRQHELESNVKSLMYLDNKVARIESDLNELILKTNRLATINQSGELQRRDSINADEDNDDGDASSDDLDDDGRNYVNKLPVQHVFGEITRLKRDVSNLKMARRQRQTGAQSPNDCLCPAGESLSLPCKWGIFMCSEVHF
jgi:hypothetical protein